jgi:hypothetical protein
VPVRCRWVGHCDGCRCIDGSDESRWPRGEAVVPLMSAWGELARGRTVPAAPMMRCVDSAHTGAGCG